MESSCSSATCCMNLIKESATTEKFSALATSLLVMDVNSVIKLGMDLCGFTN